MLSFDLSLRALLLAGLLACGAEPKGVDVSLRVKWPGTSSLLEAAEYLVGVITPYETSCLLRERGLVGSCRPLCLACL